MSRDRSYNRVRVSPVIAVVYPQHISDLSDEDEPLLVSQSFTPRVFGSQTTQCSM